MTKILKVALAVVAAIVVILDTAQADVAETLTWRDCLKQAAQHHPDLVVAREGIVQQTSALRTAGSSFFPQFTADGSASTNASSGAASAGSGNSFSYGLSGSWVIFNGLKNIEDYKSADAALAAANENFSFTSATVRYQLRSAFIAVMRAQRSLELALEIQKLRQSNVSLIQLKYDSGREHRGALLNAKAQLSQAVAEVAQSQRAISLARRQLLQEMGWGGYQDLIVKEEDDSDVPGDAAPDFKALGEIHPSYLQAIANERSAQANLNSSGAARWPEVSLTGDVSRSDTHWLPGDRGSGAGIKVSVPVFRGGAIAADIDRARSVYRQRQAETRSAFDGILVTLEENWNAFKDATANVSVQEDFLTAAMERAKIAEQQYSVGLVTFDDWTIIEDTLVSSKKALLDARMNALLAEANWIKAKGGTLEYGY